MSLPRMRTAEKVLEEIRKEDPETQLTVHYIRQMILSGAVPVVECGRKKLVSVDAIIEVLAAGYAPAPASAPLGTIRRLG